MSRTPHGNGHGHRHDQPQTPPDPACDAPSADEADEDDNAETMRLDKLSSQCAHRTWKILSLVKCLTLRWSDDDIDIRNVFEVLQTLLEPVASDLGVLDERVSDLKDKKKR